MSHRNRRNATETAIPLGRASDLRQRAEEEARADSEKPLDMLSPEETLQVLHELRVHQIELEMQNEELRRAQVELEASRARYFDLYDLAPVGYVTLSEEGIILEANLTAATLFGVAEGNFVKRPLPQFILPADQDVYYLHRKQLFETSSPQICELRMLKKDGIQFWARLEATVAQDTDGAPVCRTVVSDITERKRAEAELLEMNRHLEDATARANEMAVRAEAANVAKSDFLANMSHELRTPLNAVIGFSEGLLERANIHPLNEHQKDRLGKIKTSGEYLLQLINGILDIAKVESGKIDVHITTFDVEPVAWEISDMAEALAKDKPAVRFALDLEEHLPPITSDREKIRQILVNLLGNAIKFTERGSVVLRICGNSGSLRFSVEDTGAGIAAEHLDLLFDKFYQVKQETGCSLKGAGLGLAISKAFATLLGGTLTAQSVVGQGSTFTLTVPLMFDRRTDVDRRQDVQQTPAPRQSPPQNQQRPRALCMEANPTNVVLLTDHLAEGGHAGHSVG